MKTSQRGADLWRVVCSVVASVPRQDTDAVDRHDRVDQRKTACYHAPYLIARTQPGSCSSESCRPWLVRQPQRAPKLLSVG